jgi:hypothetical protein
MTTEFRKSTLREYFESIVIAVILALFIRTFVVQAFKIPTGSMEENLLIGDHLLVNKFVFGPTGSSLERGLLPPRVRPGGILGQLSREHGRTLLQKCRDSLLHVPDVAGAQGVAQNAKTPISNTTGFPIGTTVNCARQLTVLSLQITFEQQSPAAKREL